MALFKIEKGLAANLTKNRPNAKEGYAYFTTDDGKLYIDISGDGTIAANNTTRIAVNAKKADYAVNATNATYATSADNATNATKLSISDDTSTKIYVLGATGTGQQTIYRETSVYMQNNVLKGAAWNDYAEYREADIQEPGRCIVEQGDDTLTQSTNFMQPGAAIISDTFGFAIGETDKAKTPIAVSGRVLAYPYESLDVFKEHIGYPVCSGPNGTVSIMSDEEYKNKGYCAIGIISAVPDYETWGENNVPVNGRVWIKVI